MAKKSYKAKEPIRLRERKLKDGNRSLYLDTYRNGKRQYETLNLYLIPERDLISKERNKKTLEQANIIKAQRIVELTNKEIGIKNDYSKLLLFDWFERVKALKQNKSKTLVATLDIVQRLLIEYKGKEITIGEVDKSFCIGFIEYIKNYISNKTKKTLSKYAIRAYFVSFNISLNLAVSEGVINQNPISIINKSIKPLAPESKRVYLTMEELQRFVEYKPQTPKGYIYKNAFLFSCFTGLRFSDIINLKWENIVYSNGCYRVEIQQKKTKELLYLPISKEAQKYLSERKENNETVFGTIDSHSINNFLKQFAKCAGLKKKITFHTSRHTFATLLLTKGADLYTTSKLLGHKDIKTTQIYAKIIDQKKIQAVNLLNNILD